MASTKQLLCRYFSSGMCTFGELCHYSHDPANSVPIPEDVCNFYLRSSCMYGSNCLKKHKTVNEIIDEYKKYCQEYQITNDYSQENESLQTSSTIIPSLSLTPKSSDAIGQLPSSSSATSPSSSNNQEDSGQDQLQQQQLIVNRSYATVASSNVPGIEGMDEKARASIPLCKFYESNGYCFYVNCTFIHGDVCDLCGSFCIHPFNKQQNDLHRSECLKEHEESMELSFAFQRSKDLTCAICLEVIVEKEPRSARRFGILENCTHIYCIDCIRRWRGSLEADKKNKRRCPQCRVQSDYVIPSQYFYQEKEEKQNLIEQYKKALGDKHCKYFKNGKGTCPFDGACFYKHEYPDGRKETPKNKKYRRKVLNLPELFLFSPDFFGFYGNPDDSFSEDDFDFAF